jgi:hypothetical protein
VAAAVAAVVLAGAAVTAAVVMNGGDSGESAANGTSSAPANPPAEERDKGKSAGEKAERAQHATPSEEASPSPDSKPAGGGDEEKAADSGGGSDSGGGGSSGGDSGGSTSTGGSGSTGGGTTGDGGGEPAPAPVCHAIGGGKYNCEVWRTAKSYDAAGKEVGVLNAGTNYFFCQTQGRRETYGEWTNIWWAKTDDDSGNTGVFVSDVYIKGGDNDQPVPGLPVC